jgi:hypothetical protein
LRAGAATPVDSRSSTSEADGIDDIAGGGRRRRVEVPRDE